MRTACTWTVLAGSLPMGVGGLPSLGVCLPGGGGGLPSREVCPPGGLPSWGVCPPCPPWGSAFLGSLPSWGSALPGGQTPLLSMIMWPVMHSGKRQTSPHLWTEWVTHGCENITYTGGKNQRKVYIERCKNCNTIWMAIKEKLPWELYLGKYKVLWSNPTARNC